MSFSILSWLRNHDRQDIIQFLQTQIFNLLLEEMLCFHCLYCMHEENTVTHAHAVVISLQRILNTILYIDLLRLTKEHFGTIDSTLSKLKQG